MSDDTPDRDLVERLRWIAGDLRGWFCSPTLAKHVDEAADTIARQAEELREAREKAIEECAGVADNYTDRMRAAAGKPHPVTKRENIIAICKQDAGETLTKGIRALSRTKEGKGVALPHQTGGSGEE